MKPLSMILWPADKNDANKSYLKFLIEIVQRTEIEFFLPPNPVDIAGQFVRGEIEESTYLERVDSWWNYLFESKLDRSLENRNAIIARFAICLLSVDESSDLNEHLSWFLEV